MVPALHPLRKLLVSPASFFDERPPAETLPTAAGVVVLFTVCLVGGFFLIGAMLAGAIDGTVTMDNPDRPPDWVCDQNAEDTDSVFSDDCDEPATIERDAGALAQEAVHDLLWIAVVGPFVLWGAAGVVLFGAGRLAGGSPSFSGTLALAGWAALPELFRLAVGLVGLQFVLGGMTITNIQQADAALQSAMAPVEPVILVASLITVGWQWYLLTGGLTQEADLSWGEAGFAVGIPLGVFSLFSLV